MSNNALIADNMVVRVRNILTTSAEATTREVKVQDLIDILDTLERLAILERHLSNLVSVAYERE